jgi:DNA-binding beta-propeller fold protein YncE
MRHLLSYLVVIALFACSTESGGRLGGGGDDAISDSGGVGDTDPGGSDVEKDTPLDSDAVSPVADTHDAAAPADIPPAEVTPDDVGEDSVAPDVATDDVAGVDGSGEDTSPPEDTAVPSCEVDPPVAADGARTVLVTHPFGSEPGACGRMLRRLRLSADGALTDTGDALEIGDCPRRVAFSPDGRLALVVINNDHDFDGQRGVAVLRHHADGALEIVRYLDELSEGNPEEVFFSPDGARAYVLDFNIAGEGGVNVLDVEPGCDVQLGGFIDVALAQALAEVTSTGHLVGSAGQSPTDLSVLDLDAMAVAADYDLFSDFVSAESVALSPDGGLLLIPNASPFSELANQVTALALSVVNGAPIPTVVNTLTDIYEPSGVRFSPDGSLALVTNFSGNTVTWLDVGADGVISVGGVLPGVPLADRVDMLTRGPLTGWVLVTAVTEIATLRFTSDGLERMGGLNLGEGNSAIIGDVAVEP